MFLERRLGVKQGDGDRTVGSRRIACSAGRCGDRCDLVLDFLVRMREGRADEHFIRGAHSSRPTTEAELCALIQIDHDEVKHPVHLGEHVANGSHPTNSMSPCNLKAFAPVICLHSRFCFPLGVPAKPGNELFEDHMVLAQLEDDDGISRSKRKALKPRSEANKPYTDASCSWRGCELLVAYLS
jgi:hypothetical protein